MLLGAFRAAEEVVFGCFFFIGIEFFFDFDEDGDFSGDRNSVSFGMLLVDDAFLLRGRPSGGADDAGLHPGRF